MVYLTKNPESFFGVHLVLQKSFMRLPLVCSKLIKFLFQLLLFFKVAFVACILKNCTSLVSSSNVKSYRETFLKNYFTFIPKFLSFLEDSFLLISLSTLTFFRVSLFALVFKNDTSNKKKLKFSIWRKFCRIKKDTVFPFSTCFLFQFKILKIHNSWAVFSHCPRTLNQIADNPETIIIKFWRTSCKETPSFQVKLFFCSSTCWILFLLWHC